MTKRASAVLIHQLSKKFANLTALNNINTAIHYGELTGLAGPDGAGKTTLVRILAGLLSPSVGKAHVAGLDSVEKKALIPFHTGYMPQRFGLYEELTVMENMQLYARLRQLDTRTHSSLFEELLTFTRLTPFTDRLAGNLSGGMKQKLGLACALMARPKVLLLDEPGVGVDPVSRQDLWRMVNTLTDEGMTVIWSTAYLDEAERCDRVLLLNEGSLIYEGAPQQLTDTLAGRSYLLKNLDKNRRQHLMNALTLPSVSDGVIQGSNIRLVLKKETSQHELDHFAQQLNLPLTPTTARFEDAFIDLLGGGPEGRSLLADKIPPVQLEAQAAVSCNQLTKKFGDFTATDHVSFEVKPGEIFGLLGPNGAGKSTTFKMLCGLLKPTSGEAKVAGEDLSSSATKAKSQLGYMAQRFSLYGLLSVRQNLEFSAGVYGLKGPKKEARIHEMIDIFNLQPWLNSTPEALPLGFKQRLALACALMHRPPILFLDEPTSGVDPITRREFWSHINGLAEKGVTIMVTTHFMDEAEYCDRVALLNQAKLIALDTPDDLKRAAITKENPHPTMEDAFIYLVEESNREVERAKGDANG